MKPRRTAGSDALTRRVARLDDANIDELYELTERYETRVDLTGGSFTYVEDCQVCCQPMELSYDVSIAGRLVTVNTERVD